MIEVFTMTGGMKTEEARKDFPFNMAYLSWPFVNITATRKKLLFRALWKKWEIEKEYVETLEKHRGAFSVGLRITHSKIDFPRSFIFWTFNFAKLKLGLELLGYKLKA